MKKYSAFPYVIWTALFILLPLVLILYYSLTVKNGVTGELVFSLANYVNLFHPLYLKVFANSIYLAGLATLICLILGYPMAMIISKMKHSQTVLLLFILPMWMNFLLRTYSWMAILGRNGFINRLLSLLGVQLELLYNNNAVLLGMVYNFLPFMVLPIYTILVKMDKSLIEAAYDLGCPPWLTFYKVIFPLSLPGVISGVTMVFMPAVSTFVISDLLGGGQSVLIGNLVQEQFMKVNNWSFGSAISVILMLFILMFMRLLHKIDSKYEGAVK